MNNIRELTPTKDEKFRKSFHISIREYKKFKQICGRRKIDTSRLLEYLIREFNVKFAHEIIDLKELK